MTSAAKDDETDEAFDYTYDESCTSTNSASITAYAVYGADGKVDDTQTIENMPSVTYGETCTTIEAPASKEISGETYSFLYWAKGMTMGKKQVVSYSAKIPEYKPHEGANYLIAVYEKVGAESSETTAEFIRFEDALEKGMWWRAFLPRCPNKKENTENFAEVSD